MSLSDTVYALMFNNLKYLLDSDEVAIMHKDETRMMLYVPVGNFDMAGLVHQRHYEQEESTAICVCISPFKRLNSLPVKVSKLITVSYHIKVN